MAEAIKILKEIPLFSEIKDDPVAMEALVGVCTMREIKKDKTIIKEGEVGSEMYILAEGMVKIVKNTRAGDTYTVVRLRAEDKIFFGELALIDDDKRSATVIAIMDSQCIVISKERFLELGESHPKTALYITRAISKSLASRLRKTTGDMLTIFDALVNEIKE